MFQSMDLEQAPEKNDMLKIKNRYAPSGKEIKNPDKYIPEKKEKLQNCLVSKTVSKQIEYRND